MNSHRSCRSVKEDGSVLHDRVKHVQAVHVSEVLEVLIRVVVNQLVHQLSEPLVPEISMNEDVREALSQNFLNSSHRCAVSSKRKAGNIPQYSLTCLQLRNWSLSSGSEKAAIRRR